MRYDHLLDFGTDATGTAATTTVFPSTLTGNKQLAGAKQKELVISFETDYYIAVAAGTLVIDLYGDSAVGFGSEAVIFTRTITVPVVAGKIKAGTQYRFAIDKSLSEANTAYLRLKKTTSATNAQTGTVRGFIISE